MQRQFLLTNIQLKMFHFLAVQLSQIFVVLDLHKKIYRSTQSREGGGGELEAEGWGSSCSCFVHLIKYAIKYLPNGPFKNTKNRLINDFNVHENEKKNLKKWPIWKLCTF